MAPVLSTPLVWLALVVVVLAGWTVAQRLRHPDQRPLAAFLIFTSVVIGVAAVVFSGAVAVAVLLLPAEAAASPVTGGIVLALALAPAFALAARIVGRPPDRRMPR